MIRFRLEVRLPRARGSLSTAPERRPGVLGRLPRVLGSLAKALRSLPRALGSLTLGRLPNAPIGYPRPFEKPEGQDYELAISQIAFFGVKLRFRNGRAHHKIKESDHDIALVTKYVNV